MTAGDGRTTVVLFFSICIVIWGNSTTETRGGSRQAKAYLDEMEVSPIPNTLFTPTPATANENASLEILRLDTRLNAEQLAAQLAKAQGTSGVVSYGARNVGVYSMSAPSVSGEHRLVNSYLEGFLPYSVDNPMVPLYALAQRKQYQLDADQYEGRAEVWQSSREAYHFARGDCEDHALLLADWLIAMGEDARVVLGRYRGGGHAWVVLFKGGREYLLEATKKSGLSRTKPYPLTTLHLDYHPEFMFNRSDFWRNEGSKYTTRYASQYWKRQSHYSTSKTL